MDSKQDGIMIAKLEMGSAYDRLDWGFLEKVLTSLGFTERWIGGLDDVFVIQSLQYLWTALPPLVQVHDGTASGLCLLLIFLFYVLRCFLIYWDWRWKMAWSRDWTLIDDPLECAIYFFADDFLLFSRVTIAECDSVMAIVMHYSSLQVRRLTSASRLSLLPPPLVPDEGSACSLVGFSQAPRIWKYLRDTSQRQETAQGRLRRSTQGNTQQDASYIPPTSLWRGGEFWETWLSWPCRFIFSLIVCCLRSHRWGGQVLQRFSVW